MSNHDQLYWHFARDDRRLANGDGREVVAGETLRVEGEPIIGRWGLHASRRIINALCFASGTTICRVRLGGRVVENKGGLLVANERTCLWMIDGSRLLNEFACRCLELLLRTAKVEGDLLEWANRAIEVKRRCIRGEAGWLELGYERDLASVAVPRDKFYGHIYLSLSSCPVNSAWWAVVGMTLVTPRARDLDPQNRMLEDMVLEEAGEAVT